MDPVAHTLFGAALAESDLKSRTRYATATLVIGANLPDIDVVSGLWGADFELYFRRGLTHGVLALVLLPLLLAGGVALWHRWRGGANAAEPTGPPYRPRTLLGLAFLAVLSHPLLDWLNTYGVRLLMPFDGRWFYGDTLFIVDPWFWLLAAAGVVIARSHTRGWIARWSVLGLLTSLLILSSNLVPVSVKLLWAAGVALLVALRWRSPAWATSRNVARAGLATLLLYIGAVYGVARLAESEVSRRFPQAGTVQTNTAPGLSFRHRVVAQESALYRVVALDGTLHEVPRVQPDSVVRQAMADPSIRGFINWSRFPYWQVDDAPDAWVVTFRDLRYQGPDVPNPRGIGLAQVSVPKSATP